MFSNTLLSAVLWLPLAGAIILMAFPRRAEGAIKATALGISLLTFVLSLLIVTRFQGATAAFQLTETRDWIPDWGIQYALGVDGISLWLVLLTTFLTPIVLLSSWYSIRKHPKEYVIAMLALEFGMLGAFFALDLILFYVFFELMLIPMYLIIGVWGGKNRIYAAIKFFIFTIAGSLLMLIAILDLGWLHAKQMGSASFAITDLYGLTIEPREQLLLFIAFTLAFAIKVPLVPLHTWLPDAHVEAPTGGSIILAGVLLKLGTYGFVRFVLPFFPDATAEWAWLLGLLAVIGIIYGALIAWVQPDMKKLVAYSSVSHLGFCVLGIFAMTQASVTGSILQSINHGISTGALFLLVGVIYDRRHTRLLADFGGLARVMPIFTVLFIITALSSVGLPGLNGFVGEFLILAGSFRTMPRLTIAATTGVILAAIYLLWLVQKVFFGPVIHKENENLPDLRWNELLAVSPLIVMMVWIGLYPAPFLSRIEPSVQQLLAISSRGGNERMVLGWTPDEDPAAAAARARAEALRAVEGESR
ncbi:MAG TPA: NADH-quinone oxidoreductase subunit M [Thermoanaerobaculia bacterium]|nr:NADH-quinone oxidoreductase subunit M [Thermoanaerobaculia bacterium]